MYGNMYQQSYQRQPVPQQQPYVQPQAYTLPMIHADIIQVDSEQQAENFGVAAGTTQMMAARDDSAFFIKTVYGNGHYDFDVYEKRPQKAVEAPDYVTRSELDSLREEIESLKSNRFMRKEVDKNEPVRETK